MLDHLPYAVKVVIQCVGEDDDIINVNGNEVRAILGVQTHEYLLNQSLEHRRGIHEAKGHKHETQTALAVWQMPSSPISQVAF